MHAATAYSLHLSDHNHQADYFFAYDACLVCLYCPNPPNSDMDSRIFIVCTDVNACHCTWGCTGTERESALKVDSGKKIPYCTGESNLPQRCDGLVL